MCLGVPGRITDIRDERGTRMATVDFDGVTKTICLAYVPEAVVGDYTIVHAGFAITRLDEESAQETLRLMRDVGLLDDEGIFYVYRQGGNEVLRYGIYALVHTGMGVSLGVFLVLLWRSLGRRDPAQPS